MKAAKPGRAQDVMFGQIMPIWTRRWQVEVMAFQIRHLCIDLGQAGQMMQKIRAVVPPNIFKHDKLLSTFPMSFAVHLTQQVIHRSTININNIKNI